MPAERAIEIVPSAKLGVLVGGVARLDQLPRRNAARRPVRGGSQAALLERTYVVAVEVVGPAVTPGG
jgi:hypothetical protein